ncbi:HDOD domain-containing protein [Methylotuvimicrobium sp. KM2]|uniref:HDOD domain-containing protein n=1 Tax=Methylotuvimicrobium sp. KM2 TaxID=3133976 RepID=UPI0031010F0D
MFNWFYHLIDHFTSKSPKAKNDQQENVDDRPTSADPILAGDKPFKTSRIKQPVEILKQFVPIRNLDDAAIELLQQRTNCYRAGATIFVRGQSNNDKVLYLHKGTLELTPDCESIYQISTNSPLSHLPLNSGKTNGATAIAKTDVKIIEISAELIKLWTEQSKTNATQLELIDIDLPKQIEDNGFFADFSRIYRENKLTLPSLPAVALKLKQAMEFEIDVREAAKIIQIDPPIATKLVQIANSPLYSPISPVTNCQEAVTRLGLNATRQLVMGIGLKQMFRCQNKHLLGAMQSLWKNSLYISSLSFILAQESGQVNPEDALLAGLISDIGIIPLLHFAEQHPEHYKNRSDLDEAIPVLRAPIGKLVLHTLGFSEELEQIPHHAEDWYYDSGDKLTLTDIVILAKLHSYIGIQHDIELPYINSIPAYTKLNNGKLTPDFSLHILHKAQQRIDAAMHILS